MSMSDLAIEQEEERYQELADQAERDHLQEMEDEHLYEADEDDSVDDLVDEWLELRAEEREVAKGVSLGEAA